MKTTNIYIARKYAQFAQLQCGAVERDGKVTYHVATAAKLRSMWARPVRVSRGGVAR